MEIMYISFIHLLIISYSGLATCTGVGTEVRIYKAQVHAPDFQTGRGD